MFEPEKIRTVFWGTPEFALASFFELLQKNYNLIAVVTQPDKPVGRRQELTPSAVKKSALKYNLNVLEPENINNKEFINQIKKLSPDLCIVVAYGKIIAKEILEIPKYGFINLHASLLPKLRGASPIQTAILENHQISGVTIMLMDEKMDRGPILSQKQIALANKETFVSLEDKLKKLGAELLVEAIPPYILGNLKLQPQDESQATYTKLITRELGKVDLEKDNPFEIERKIRALSPWPGVWTTCKNKRLKILAAQIENKKLILQQVQLEGKKPVNWQEFIRGN